MTKTNRICIVTRIQDGLEFIVSAHRGSLDAFNSLLKRKECRGSYSRALYEGYRVRSLRNFLAERNSKEIATFCGTACIETMRDVYQLKRVLMAE